MVNCRLEYVFGPDRPNFGHCLGVNSLKLSKDIVLTPESHGTLFSGGRDGRVNAWSLTEDGAKNTLMTECHTNNVSDVLPISENTVASCSTDTTVKLWNVKTDTVSLVGHHTDYAECLARFSDNILCSGGLDDRLIGWDLNADKQAFDLQVNHSVYTLAAVPNRFLLTGSPDGAIRIWDPRQANHTMKLVGHSDSVRSLLVADSQQYLVSGSSDATAILWNLRIGRAVRTSNVFESSVWALTRYKNGFLAGDRNGSVYEADSMENEPRLIIDNKNEQFAGLSGICHDRHTDSLWMSTQFNPTIYETDVRGEERSHLEGHVGLKKHRLLNDKRRSLILDTKGKVSMVDLISARSIDFERHIDMNQDLDDALDEILNEVNTMDVLDNWCQVQIKAGQICVVLDGRSVNNTEIYLDELMEYVAKTTKSPLTTPAISPVSSGLFRQISPAVSRVTSTQSLTEVMQKDRQSKVSTQNLGSGKGKAKFYNPGNDDESESSDDDEFEDASSLRNGGIDDDATNANTNANTSTNANASTNASLSPNTPGTSSTNKPKSVRLPPVDANPTVLETEEAADENTVDDEIRINLGNFVLENLLRGVTDRLYQKYTDMIPTSASNPNQNQNQNQNQNLKTKRRPVEQITARSPSPPQVPHVVPKKQSKGKRFFKKLFGKSKKEVNPPHYNQHSQYPHSSSKSDTDSQAQSTQRMKDQKNIDLSKEPDSKTFKDAWNRAVSMKAFEAADPEAPGHDIVSRKTRIVVTLTEIGGAPTEVFSTTVGKLIDNETESEKIAEVLPGWVGDAVLLGKLHLRQPTKIGFEVEPSDPNMPRLATTDTRLMAIGMLRARKIMIYVIGQLQDDKILTAKASEYNPEDIISLKCGDKEIAPLTTLATIRTRIWRQGGDVRLTYSVKQKV